MSSSDAHAHIDAAAHRYETERWSGSVFDRLYDPVTCE